MTHIVIILGCKKVLRKKEKETNITNYSHVYSRLMKGLEIFNSIPFEDKYVVCSGIGEAKLMKNFLVEREILYNKILVEPFSRNTIENCLQTYHMLSSMEIIPSSIYLVTNDYHIKRSEIIFNYFLSRFNYNCFIYCFSGKISDYIPDFTLADAEEIEDSFRNENNIIQNHLEHSITHYRNLIL